MTKTAIDYSKTLIYKIVCKDLNINFCYISSTTDFIRRKSFHCMSCNKSEYNEKPLYKFIRDNGSWSNFEMIEIEKYPCRDKNEAQSRERDHKEILHASGSIICFEENDSATKKKNKCKRWISKNREKYNEYQKLKQKEYYHVNKCFSEN